MISLSYLCLAIETVCRVEHAVSNITQSVCDQMLIEKHIVIFRCDLRWCIIVTSAAYLPYLFTHSAGLFFFLYVILFRQYHSRATVSCIMFYIILCHRILISVYSILISFIFEKSKFVISLEENWIFRKLKIKTKIKFQD